MPNKVIGSDKIRIQWPISDDELSKMSEEQLGQILANAQADYETKADSVLDLIQRIESPYKSALHGDFFKFMRSVLWKMHVYHYYLTVEAEHPRPDDKG